MDIYSFLNSPDVAAHCKQIQKTWNPLEMAVIINMSCHPLSQKHAAYRELLSTYGDFLINKPPRYEGVSFQAALRAFLSNEECNIECFCKEIPGTIYLAKVSEENDRYSESGPLSTFEKAIAFVKERYQVEQHGINCICIKRQRIDSDETMSLDVDQTGEILRLNDPKLFDGEDESPVGFLYDFYIDIPTPFQKGDILMLKGTQSWISETGIVVLDSSSSDQLDYHSKHLRSGDASDMYAIGYTVSHGRVVFEDMMRCDELRYFSGELEGESEILKYISLYLKGELCLAALIHLQDKVYFEYLAKMADSCSSVYDLSCIEAPHG